MFGLDDYDFDFCRVPTECPTQFEDAQMLVYFNVLADGRFGQCYFKAHAFDACAVTVVRGVHNVSKESFMELRRILALGITKNFRNVTRLVMPCKLAAYESLPHGLMLLPLNADDFELTLHEALKHPDVNALSLLHDVFSGLNELHSSGIVHGRLTIDQGVVVSRAGDAANVRFIAKVTDWAVPRKDGGLTPLIRRSSLAPELRTYPDPDSAKSMEADVYALGRLTYYILLRGDHKPKDGTTVPTLVLSKLPNMMPDLDLLESEFFGATRLIKQCLFDRRPVAESLRQAYLLLAFDSDETANKYLASQVLRLPVVTRVVPQILAWVRQQRKAASAEAADNHEERAVPALSDRDAGAVPALNGQQEHPTHPTRGASDKRMALALSDLERLASTFPVVYNTKVPHAELFEDVFKIAQRPGSVLLSDLIAALNVCFQRWTRLPLPGREPVPLHELFVQLQTIMPQTTYRAWELVADFDSLWRLYCERVPPMIIDVEQQVLLEDGQPTWQPHAPSVPVLLSTGSTLRFRVRVLGCPSMKLTWCTGSAAFDTFQEMGSNGEVISVLVVRYAADYKFEAVYPDGRASEAIILQVRAKKKMKKKKKGKKKGKKER